MGFQTILLVFVSGISGGSLNDVLFFIVIQSKKFVNLLVLRFLEF